MVESWRVRTYRFINLWHVKISIFRLFTSSLWSIPIKMNWPIDLLPILSKGTQIIGNWYWVEKGCLFVMQWSTHEYSKHFRLSSKQIYIRQKLLRQRDTEVLSYCGGARLIIQRKLKDVLQLKHRDFKLQLKKTIKDN